MITATHLWTLTLLFSLIAKFLFLEQLLLVVRVVSHYQSSKRYKRLCHFDACGKQKNLLKLLSSSVCWCRILYKLTFIKQSHTEWNYNSLTRQLRVSSDYIICQLLMYDLKVSWQQSEIYLRAINLHFGLMSVTDVLCAFHF